MKSLKDWAYNAGEIKFAGIPLVKTEEINDKKIVSVLGVAKFCYGKKYVWKKYANGLPQYKRVAVFASFSKDLVITEYMVYYLRELNKVADGIIFVADNYYPEEEINKIKDFIIYAECQKHREYDFGSYKRGLIWALESGILKDAQELIMCNDSCVGPVFPFAEMFDEMDRRNKDFWGITQNEDVNFDRHIQSYFMAFSNKVFNSECFINFFKQIKKKLFKMWLKNMKLSLPGI